MKGGRKEKERGMEGKRKERKKILAVLAATTVGQGRAVNSKQLPHPEESHTATGAALPVFCSIGHHLHSNLLSATQGQPPRVH